MIEAAGFTGITPKVDATGPFETLASILEKRTRYILQVNNHHIQRRKKLTSEREVLILR
jgi:hypothetical protein